MGKKYKGALGTLASWTDTIAEGNKRADIWKARQTLEKIEQNQRQEMARRAMEDREKAMEKEKPKPKQRKSSKKEENVEPETDTLTKQPSDILYSIIAYVIVGGIFLVVFGLPVILVVTMINNANSVPAPEISIEGATGAGGEYHMTIENGTEIKIETGSEIKTCDEKNGYSLKINDKEVSKGTCSYKIAPYDKDTTYKIVAENKSGKDEVTLEVERTEEKRNTKETTPTSNKVSQVDAHLACKSYASNYFFPLEASLESILGEGNTYDYQDGDGWFYRPLAKVTSAAGGETWYHVACKVDASGNVTSFYAWQ